MDVVTQVCLCTSLTFHAQGNNDAASCSGGPVFVYLGKFCHLQCILHYRHMKMNQLCRSTLRWCRTLVIRLNTRLNLRKKNKSLMIIFTYIFYKKTLPHHPGSEHGWNFDSAWMTQRSFTTQKFIPADTSFWGTRISCIKTVSKFPVV